MELKVYNISGQETAKKATLNDEIFAIEPNDHAIYLDVKLYLANQRQGTHKAKQKHEVNYSSRKLHRQKGTGGSRKGSVKSPLFRHGGRVFGPQPRDYSFKLNKKLKALARKSALSYKAKGNGITIVENFSLDTPKTKQYLEILKNLKVDNKKSLVVLAESNKNIYLSSRNLGGTKVVTASELNTYDILNANNLVLDEGSLTIIENILTK
jgi:large subunit ribosomal protein L4